MKIAGRSGEQDFTDIEGIDGEPLDDDDPAALRVSERAEINAET